MNRPVDFSSFHISKGLRAGVMDIYAPRAVANESQDHLAEKLEKSRVAVSDIERGRVAVSAADIALIAAHYSKPIALFYSPRVSVSKSDLSPLARELKLWFEELPETQQRIALECVKQQVTVARRAEDREFLDRFAATKAARRKKK